MASHHATQIGIRRSIFDERLVLRALQPPRGGLIQQLAIGVLEVQIARIPIPADHGVNVRRDTADVPPARA
jgi:hypothetical protein